MHGLQDVTINGVVVSYRFYERENLRTGPAWHKLADPSKEDLTIQESWMRINPYDTVMLPAYTKDPDTGEEIEIEGWRWIMRVPTPDQPKFIAFNPVSSDFGHVGPQQFVDIIGNTMGKRPIETLGVLDGGKRMFATYKLGEFDIVGDPHEFYAMITAGFDGSRSIVARNISDRAVCRNTVGMAERSSVPLMTIRHNRNAANSFQTQFNNMMDHVLNAQPEAVALYTMLAKKRITGGQRRYLLDQIFALRDSYEKTFDPKENEQRQRDLDYANSVINERRDVVDVLADGAGFGQSYASCQGTAYGLLQAFAEAAQYGWKVTPRGENGAIADALFGQAFRRQERLLEMLIEL